MCICCIDCFLLMTFFGCYVFKICSKSFCITLWKILLFCKAKHCWIQSIWLWILVYLMILKIKITLWICVTVAELYLKTVFYISVESWITKFCFLCALLNLYISIVKLCVSDCIILKTFNKIKNITRISNPYELQNITQYKAHR